MIGILHFPSVVRAVLVESLVTCSPEARSAEEELNLLLVDASATSEAIAEAFVRLWACDPSPLPDIRLEHWVSKRHLLHGASRRGVGAALERHLDRRWSCRPTLPFCAATAPLFERFWRYLGQHPDAECSRLLDDPTESLASKLAPLTQQEAHTAMRGFSDATSSVALDLSCTCASCGTRVPGTAST